MEVTNFSLRFHRLSNLRLATIEEPHRGRRTEAPNTSSPTAEAWGTDLDQTAPRATIAIAVIAIAAAAATAAATVMIEAGATAAESGEIAAGSGETAARGAIVVAVIATTVDHPTRTGAVILIVRNRTSAGVAAAGMIGIGMSGSRRVWGSATMTAWTIGVARAAARGDEAMSTTIAEGEMRKTTGGGAHGSCQPYIHSRPATLGRKTAHRNG